MLAGELFGAGLLGLLTFQAFWRSDGSGASPGDRAGSFFWVAAGLGLMVMALDDIFEVHEHVGAWVATHVDVATWFTGNLDQVIPISYALAGASLLWIFRDEVRAPRASSAFVLLGSVFAALMLVADVAAGTPLGLLEGAAQGLAAALTLLALLVRYREVLAVSEVVPVQLTLRVPRSSTD
ncbi:MAG: hypothetical protein O2895_06205 [Chloroflexi bacterium]|nr:hypothetical protein [Chloroflexota bacterium]